MKWEEFKNMNIIKQRQFFSRKINGTLKYFESMRHSDGNFGYCVRCHEEHFSIEPDAENYHCDNCNENSVQGIDNLVISGQIRYWDESGIDLNDIREHFKKLKFPVYGL